MNRKSILNKFKQHAPVLWWGDRFDVRFHLVHMLQGVSCKKILDIGCGIGIILSEIPAKTNLKIGLEISRKALITAKKIERDADFVLGDMYFLPFKEKIFDYVILANTLSKYEIQIDPCMTKTSTPEIQMREVNRILRNEGTFFLTTPNRNHRVYRRSQKIDYKSLCDLLNPYFRFKVSGFNPIPIILSERVVDRWIFGEFYMRILEILMGASSLKGIGKFFFVQAQRKQPNQIGFKDLRKPLT